MNTIPIIFLDFQDFAEDKNKQKNNYNKNGKRYPLYRCQPFFVSFLGSLLTGFAACFFASLVTILVSVRVRIGIGPGTRRTRRTGTGGVVRLIIKIVWTINCAIAIHIIMSVSCITMVVVIFARSAIYMPAVAISSACMCRSWRDDERKQKAEKKISIYLFRKIAPFCIIVAKEKRKCNFL